jgi:hypothetical protein
LRHEWILSTLGHGETMCKFCHITNREAAVLRQTDEPCPNAPAQASAPAANDKTQEAVNLLQKWCGLFFGRNGDGTHMDKQPYVEAHTKVFMETADWLRANGFRN